MRASATGACLRRPPVSMWRSPSGRLCGAGDADWHEFGACWKVGHVVFVCDVCAICRPLSLTGAVQPWCVVSLSLTEWRAGACSSVRGSLRAAVVAPLVRKNKVTELFTGRAMCMKGLISYTVTFDSCSALPILPGSAVATPRDRPDGDGFTCPDARCWYWGTHIFAAIVSRAP